MLKKIEDFVANYYTEILLVTFALSLVIEAAYRSTR